MDMDLARTFLAVEATGNFYRASEALNVTQSTVSMRVKTLEQIIGKPLFARSKKGTTLTPAGQQFRSHAAALVRVWENAVQELALSPAYDSILAVGGQFTLWDRLLLHWLPWIRTAIPAMAIRAEVGLSDDLMRRLIEGTIDIAAMYTPQSRPGMVAEELLVERLIMVSSDENTQGPKDAGYVFVDWGAEFLDGHNQAYPDLDTPHLQVSHGPLGLQYILDNGGSGYFPVRTARPYLDSGRLHRVEKAKEFRRPAYLVYPADRDDSSFIAALDGLRHVAAL